MSQNSGTSESSRTFSRFQLSKTIDKDPWLIFFFLAMILQVVGAGHGLQGPCHDAHRWERAAVCYELRARLMILMTVPEMYRTECSQMLRVVPN